MRTFIAATAATALLLPATAVASTHVSYDAGGTAPTLQVLGAVWDYRLGTTGELAATLVDRGPLFGEPIDFYVNGERVCSATISGPELLTDPTGYAICRDPVAIAKTVAAGGYEARADQFGRAASAGLIQTDAETATP